LDVLINIKKFTDSYTNRSKQEHRIENTEDVRPVQVIPKLRREIDITDYDSGQPRRTSHIVLTYTNVITLIGHCKIAN
jgi:hypothetical protein